MRQKNPLRIESLQLVAIRPFLKLHHVEHMHEFVVYLSAKPLLGAFFEPAAIKYDDCSAWVLLTNVEHQVRELLIDRAR